MRAIDHGNSMPPCRRERLLLVALVRRKARVEHAADGKRVEHLGGTSDVIGLRVRENERVEAVDAELVQAPRDVGVRRPGVDQHCES